MSERDPLLLPPNENESVPLSCHAVGKAWRQALDHLEALGHPRADKVCAKLERATARSPGIAPNQPGQASGVNTWPEA